MKKIIRIGKMEDQDEFRREDIRKMSPSVRVDMVLKMQSQFFKWNLNPKIERTATVRKIDNK